MSISFTITVYNEYTEFQKLSQILKDAKSYDDELIVLHTFKHDAEQDTDNFQAIKNIALNLSDTYENFHFQNKFADLKNHLNQLATKDYIFNFDADELCSIDTIIQWKQIVLNHPQYDLYYVPRINTVSNYTIEDIQKYQWNINSHGWINWPDYQPRVFCNNNSIKWQGNVHEAIIGYKNAVALPAEPNLAIIHHKTIERQREQNSLYETINR